MFHPTSHSQPYVHISAGLNSYAATHSHTPLRTRAHAAWRTPARNCHSHSNTNCRVSCSLADTSVQLPLTFKHQLPNLTQPGGHQRATAIHIQAPISVSHAAWRTSVPGLTATRPCSAPFSAASAPLLQGSPGEGRPSGSCSLTPWWSRWRCRTCSSATRALPQSGKFLTLPLNVSLKKLQTFPLKFSCKQRRAQPSEHLPLRCIRHPGRAPAAHLDPERAGVAESVRGHPRGRGRGRRKGVFPSARKHTGAHLRRPLNRATRLFWFEKGAGQNNS